jgi:arylsulfatase A-like enzyme
MKPSFNEADMSDKPAWMQSLPMQDKKELTRIYNERIAAMRAVDDLIERLIVSLIKAGELNNTVLIFTSDNGYLFGEHRWKSKVVLYEESIRVPLFIRLPQSNAPAIINGIALNNDLAPTIADLADVTPWHEVDGRSLLPLLQSTGTAWRKRFLIEHPPAGTSFPIPPYLAVRETNSSSRGSLVYAETLSNSVNSAATDKELYDLGIDPFQLDSLHADFSLPRILQRIKLQNYIEQLKTCANGTCQAIEDYTGN